MADPKFVDAAHGDFRLKADSPALKLGFLPIDTAKIGLYGEPDWVALPKRIVRQAYVPNLSAESPPEPVDDDFEGAVLGAPPDGGTVSTENVGGIVVTNETAASGKQCLKFIDAPGQKFSFNPHLVYSPRFTTGKIQGSFDVRIEPGAIGHFEWRDYSSGEYRVGPSVRIEGDGKLLAGGKPIGKIPLSRWLHVEITCGLGTQANGRWTLRHGPTGGPMNQIELPCDPKFKRLDWAGFVADATIAAVFYVDNIKLGPGPAR